MFRTTPIALLGALAAVPALADAPRVATDIAPVHSLVARIMEGVGVPDLVIPQEASPHDHALRPSEAEALQEADLIFWIGAELTPQLDGALDALAGGAETVSLLDVEGTRTFGFREGALFEAHGHDAHGHEGHGDDHGAHGDEDHAEAGHDDHADRDDHGDEHAGHDREGVDPHAWLLPGNAAVWSGLIAERLAAADPANADLYRANAEVAHAELDALTGELDAILAPVRGRPFVVFHDAYRYFEESFGMPASGAISVGDAARPSPGRIAGIRDRIAAEGIVCVLSEPQFNAGLVAAVSDGGTGTATVDPIGVGLKPGPALYGELMRDMAEALADCLGT